MAPRRVGDAAAWDAALLALGARAPDAPGPHVLQSWSWGEIKARWGWHVERLVWGEPDAPLAAAQVMRRRVGRLPLSIGYAPKGPFVATPTGDAGVDAWSTVLADLEDWARLAGVATLKIDPDVDARRADVRAVWTGRGWRPSAEQVQFANTMRSPLPPAADTADIAARLLAGYREKTRYNVRLAERRGVAVRLGAADPGSSDLATFYDLYAATARRQGFGIRARAYYLDVWRTFVDAGRAAVLLAERDGRALAGAIPVRFGTTAWYLYGASADDGRSDMAPYAALHAALCWSAAQGCTTFDWWGGPTDPADPADPLSGVARFKSGFGAVQADQLGAYDFAAAPLSARALDVAAALRRRWLRR